MKAIIADDETSARLTLRSIVQAFFKELEIVGEADSPNSAEILIEEVQPDIAFWDIQMGDETRFTILERIIRKNIQVVIVSAERSKAYDSLPFKATDYLLKPIRIKDLRMSLEKCRTNLMAQEEGRQKL